jgi:hypothetical protein
LQANGDGPAISLGLKTMVLPTSRDGSALSGFCFGSAHGATAEPAIFHVPI